MIGYLVIAENLFFALSLFLRTICLMKVVDFYDTDDAGMIKRQFPSVSDKSFGGKAEFGLASL